MDRPLVSVAMTAFNHERFVTAAALSVLGQTHRDLELVAVDDGSTDATWAALSAIDDPRLVRIRRDNGGPGAATNTALAACRGQYVALMSGDDLCRPERIDRQLAEIGRGGDRLLVSSVGLIDDDGRAITSGHYAVGHFDLEPLTRAQVVERFFFRGNFLSGITAFGPARVWRELTPYDPALYQAQDFDMWVRAVKRYDIGLMPEPLCDYRFRAAHGNLSAITPETQTRLSHELRFIMSRFFDGMSAELFREAFRAHLIDPECPSAEAVACEQAFLLSRSPEPYVQLLGLERLYHLLNDPASRDVLAGRYGMTHVNYVEKLRHADLMNRYPRTLTALFVDTGRGFGGEARIESRVWHGGSDFLVSFDLSRFPGARLLRWDPAYMRPCAVWFDAVTFTVGGQTQPLDLSRVASNGTAAEGGFRCDRLDAMLFVPVPEGDVSSVTLRGRWKIADADEALTKAHGQIGAGQQQIVDLNGQCQQAEAEVRLLRAELDSIHQSRGYQWLQRARRAAAAVRRAG